MRSYVKTAKKGGDHLIDLSDPEVRLLLASTMGWLLVGALTAMLIRQKKKEKE